MKKRDYHPSLYPNPFRKNRGDRKLLKKICRGFSFLFLAGLIFFTIYLIFFSPYFIIGEDKIKWESKNKLELDLKSRQEFYYFLANSPKHLYFIPATHLLFLNQNFISEYLKNKYNLKTIIVEKKIPPSLKISYEIKAPTFLWQEGSHHYLVDDMGEVVKEIDILSFPQNLPLISRTTSTSIMVGEILIKEELVNFIRDLLEKINRLNFPWKFSKIEFINNQVPTVVIITNEGWKIYFSQNLEIDTQLIKLLKILDQEGFDRHKIEYIDLQLSNKVFYK